MIRYLKAALLAVSLSFCALPAGAGAAPLRAMELNIAAQPLSKALNEFGRQTGLQVVFFLSDVEEDLTSPHLKGSYTPQAALEQMLANTSLRYELINERTVAIRSRAVKAADDENSARAQSGISRADLGPIRLSRADRNDSMQGTVAKDLPKDSTAPGIGIPEILVKGRRTLNADIRRTEDDVQPYVVFEREEIERSMLGNLEEFLKTRLPMNAVESTYSQGGGSFGNQSQIDLRGLGTNQTLILVNGRRVPGISAINFNGDLNQPDINGIPMAAVERIEVLPSTASGIYGGGATGGVVNVILRQDYAGVEVRASYDNTFDTDAARRRLDASAGFSLEGGKSHVTIAASHSEANPLLVRDRDFAARGRALMYDNDPAAFTSSSNPPWGYTSNIRSSNGAPLLLKDNTSLGFAYTHVPVGYAGTASDNGAALVAYAGSYNLDLPDDLRGSRESIANHPTVQALSVSLQREFGARVQVFGDFASFDNEGRFQSTGNPTSVAQLPPDAPNNPFLNTIRVSYPLPDLAFDRHSRSQTLRASTGLIVRLPHDWSAQGEYGWSRSRYSLISTNPALSRPSNVFSSGAIDVMRDVNAFPIDYSPFILSSPNRFEGPYDTVLRDATLRVAGPVLDLPAGALTISALLERRKEEALNGFAQYIDPTTDTLDDPQLRPSRRQQVDSMYLEAQLPLISAANARRGAHKLELQASVRRDEYRTIAPYAFDLYTVPSRDGPLPDVPRSANKVASIDYTAGLRYSPIRDLALRASFGTGFLAPSLSQIVSSENDNGFLSGADPKRGNTPTFIFPLPQISGGNPDLQPESSVSFSAGVILTPRFASGLRVSVDYTRIRKTDEITLLPQQLLLDNEEAFPGRIMRAPLTPEDEALGYTGGEVVGIDTSYLNIARAWVEAYDLQADYSWETDAAGAFNIFVVATHQARLERQVTSDSITYEYTGYSGGPLQWRGNAGASWSLDSWSVNWNAQMYDSRLVYSSLNSPAGVDTAIRRQGAAKIPSQIYHDLTVGYRFGQATALGGLLSDTDLTLGIRNLFDRHPPIIATTGTVGGYSTYGDARLRSYVISVRKNF